MFNFFKLREWLVWSWGGLVTIILSSYMLVQLDVMINEWFGSFYDGLQKALGTPGAVSLGEFYGYMWEFGLIAGAYVILAVSLAFFTSHWCFRWRTSMANYYHAHWNGKIEGASQRVQEDTLKFARLTEKLGSGVLEALMILFSFIPILFTLSKQITYLPIFGEVDGSLVWVAVMTALGGTVVLSIVGGKLPGIEYGIQKREAAYRKRLVHMEDDEDISPESLGNLYDRVRKVHYKSYLHYGYFNVAKFSYLQGMVLVPYIAMAPTIVAGVVTLGFVSQISRAFGKVAESLQFIIRSWGDIVELMSVWKRLSEFERGIRDGK